MRRDTTISRISQPLTPIAVDRASQARTFAQHGSLFVERAIEGDFIAAESYLRADSVMRRTFDDLENASTATYVIGNHRNDDHFDFEHRAVTWDPHSALRTTTGGAQSPALGLGHELVHADEAADKREYLATTFDAAYDDKEERRVIVGAETHAARTLGEGTRHDHSGRVFTVDSPTAFA